MDSFIPTDPKALPLSTEECRVATQELHSNSMWPKINRKMFDPIKQGDHRFALFSFIKSASATPDADGFFGVAKIRGSFYTEQDAAVKAEEIIRDVDSTNSIYTCLIGAPIPLVVRGHAAELSEVDLQNKIEKCISENVKAKRLAEKKEMDEIMERRDALMKNDGKIAEDDDPEKKYVEQRVKLAHLRYVVEEHAAKHIECSELAEITRQNLLETLKEHPEYESGYLERYKRGRRDAHVPESSDFTGFMKFMADPLE
jgi:hypothetical protein